MPGQGTRDIDDAEMYLINALEAREIYTFHFFVGHVAPELSMNGERWRNGYFAEWQLNRLLDHDFDKTKISGAVAVVKTLDVNGIDSPKDKTVKPRTGIYGDRDLDAAVWVRESGADLEKMTVTEIKKALKARDVTRDKKLWSHGFDDWNRDQEVWPKKKPGKKSGK
jgi:IS4 transposase